ncbi:hypothetical protein [Candidatus Lokiarchaeum ossiferum]|uniref:hypothetical protein n=1 Tax=Candidatus Lokiarchaeum ossiferum TaxID=2951803 RepID=UPI00352DAF83
MSTSPNQKQQTIFIFDANFFISLKEIKANLPYQHLAAAKSALKVEFYVSGPVFNECPFIVGTIQQQFYKAVKVEKVKEVELTRVKDDLKRKGVRLLAQDPDLSLVALGKRLKTNSSEVFIVSDDFKLSQNIDTLGYRMKCLPLPAFLQILGKNLTGKHRTYWKLIRKKVLTLNLDFMMKRSDIYAPQAKIAWLIENAVSVAGEGIHLNDSNIDPKEKEPETLDDIVKLRRICDDFIRGKKIPPSDMKQIKIYQKALDTIKEGRVIIKEAKEALMKSNHKLALRQLRKVNEQLIQTFQIMGATLSENAYHFFERLMASEISKVVFLRSFVLIENNRITSALSALDQTAFFATMAQIPETVLTINYLKGLLYIYNSFYKRAINQFQFNFKLADSLKVRETLANTLKLKAIIGESITSFLIDQQEEAVKQVQTAVSHLSPKMLPSLMTALTDSGDYFLALGFPEIASNLYSEALECAIDSGRKWRYNILISKMKKAYMASSLIGTETRPSGDISVLIDKFHDIKDVDTYNEIMTELALFTNKFYEPFKFFSEGTRKLTKYADLPKEFHDEWECVKIQENKKTGRTLLIGLNEEVGLVAFDVLLDTNLDGVPENYTIKIRETAKIRIDPPDEIKESLFLIRAIVKTNNEDRDIEIVRKIPIFFKQMA